MSPLIIILPLQLNNLGLYKIIGSFIACLIGKLLKTVDIRSPKTVISVHFSSSKPMAMQIY